MSTTIETKAAESLSSARPSSAWRHLSVGDLSRVAVLVALVIVGQAIAPSFLSLANIHVILLAVAAIGIMAYGMTLVVITGEIDLSIAGAAILSCVVGGLLIPTGSAALVIGATLLTGLAVGLTNGVLVAALGIPSLIATLGTLGIGRALANIISGGQALYPEGLDGYLWLGRGDFLGVPMPVVLLLGNVRAAALSGINVIGIRITVFAISGVCAALAGMLGSARLSYINPAAFEGMELSVLAVTVLGGAALSGGVGSISGTLLAAMIIGVVNNLLNQMGVSIYLQQVVTAAVILAVVLPGMWQRGIAK